MVGDFHFRWVQNGQKRKAELAPLRDRSAPSDAGRRPSVLGMPRAARGCARASYLQPRLETSTPTRLAHNHLTTFARKATRDAVSTPPVELLLQARCQHNRRTPHYAVSAPIA